LAKLEAGIGSPLHIGATSVVVTRVLDYRPDQGSGFADLSATLLINIADIPATQLIQPGSRVTRTVLFAGDPADVSAFREQLQAQKKRVIVDEFDYSTVKTQVQAVFNTQQDIGKGIRAMLVKRVADANNLVVVERAKIQNIMKEQDFNASNRVKQGSGARVGQISGADAQLSGDIVGIEVGGAVKNVLAVGAGLVAGILETGEDDFLSDDTLNTYCTPAVPSKAGQCRTFRQSQDSVQVSSERVPF
jgi:hypothetical protein